VEDLIAMSDSLLEVSRGDRGFERAPRREFASRDGEAETQDTRPERGARTNITRLSLNSW